MASKADIAAELDGLGVEYGNADSKGVLEALLDAELAPASRDQLSVLRLTATRTPITALGMRRERQ
jgi:hypothetical protein